MNFSCWFVVTDQKLRGRSFLFVFVCMQLHLCQWKAAAHIQTGNHTTGSVMEHWNMRGLVLRMISMDNVRRKFRISSRNPSPFYFHSVHRTTSSCSISREKQNSEIIFLFVSVSPTFDSQETSHLDKKVKRMAISSNWRRSSPSPTAINTTFSLAPTPIFSTL